MMIPHEVMGAWKAEQIEEEVMNDRISAQVVDATAGLQPVVAHVGGGARATIRDRADAIPLASAWSY